MLTTVLAVQDIQRRLWEAVAGNRAAEVEALMQHGNPLCMRRAAGQDSVLHHAIYCEAAASAQVLACLRPVLVMQEDAASETPFRLALQDGHLELAKFFWEQLLVAGYSTDDLLRCLMHKNADGATVMHILAGYEACYAKGAIKLLFQLCSRLASGETDHLQELITSLGPSNNTPVHEAAAEGKLGNLRLMLAWARVADPLHMEHLERRLLTQVNSSNYPLLLCAAEAKDKQLDEDETKDYLAVIDFIVKQVLKHIAPFACCITTMMAQSQGCIHKRCIPQLASSFGLPSAANVSCDCPDPWSSCLSRLIGQ